MADIWCQGECLIDDDNISTRSLSTTDVAHDSILIVHETAITQDRQAERYHRACWQYLGDSNIGAERMSVGQAKQMATLLRSRTSHLVLEHIVKLDKDSVPTLYAHRCQIRTCISLGSRGTTTSVNLDY